MTRRALLMAEFRFPDGFLWGTATSAHQVEGNNVHNDWWAWEQAGRVHERSGLACDQYYRFADDFDLAASLGHNAHRFSLEWSRIEPREGQWDDEAIAHYVEVVRALRVRRLEPVVTLHHYTNPHWLHQAGGWTNAKTVDRFARYTERVAAALIPLVRYWITFNEPMVYVHMHYIEGVGPPGARDVRQALRVTQHLLHAHAAAHQVLHAVARDTGAAVQVSVAKYSPVFVPCRPAWPLDRVASSLTDRVFNAAFLEALTEGRWSVPGLARWTIREAARTLDFLGVNFYRRQFIRGGWRPSRWVGAACSELHASHGTKERSAMGWDVSPEAFFRTLVRWGSLGVPILVTENGTWMQDDSDRWKFIARHLAAVAEALGQGVRVLGYLYWSLIDNFEWAHGFGPRFGLIEVDYATQRRTIRDSARKYAEVCKSNRLLLENEN